jgi:hypothetical protein
VPKKLAPATSRPSPAIRESPVATAKIAVLSASRRLGGGGDWAAVSPVPSVVSAGTGPL